MNMDPERVEDLRAMTDDRLSMLKHMDNVFSVMAIVWVCIAALMIYGIHYNWDKDRHDDIVFVMDVIVATLYIGASIGYWTRSKYGWGCIMLLGLSVIWYFPYGLLVTLLNWYCGYQGVMMFGKRGFTKKQIDSEFDYRRSKELNKTLLD